MESHLLPYRNSRIHYLKFGSGARYLFCFHGYGEDAASFRFLERMLGEDYTLIAIDFPFHGQTQWNEGLAFTPQDLQQVIGMLVPLELQTVSMIGYSMGGRIAMAALQQLKNKVDRVVLVAPDGLHRNFWYWFSTQTLVGNRIFAYTMRKPSWFFSGMQLLKTFRLLNKSIFRFAHAYLDDQQQREMLYKRWTTMRKFRPEHAAITGILQEYQVPLRMLFGKYDRVILAKRSASLDRQNDTIQVKTISAGHQLLKAKYAREIAALFYE